MPTRREFLLTASALALSACTHKSPVSLINSVRRRNRYVVVTQSSYWSAQNLEELNASEFVSLPEEPQPEPTDHYSVLTVVNDDGTGLRRVRVPRYYHCATSSAVSGLIYLIGNRDPSSVVAFDLNSLEYAFSCSRPSDGDGRVFSGHGFPIPGTNALAFTMSELKLGKYGEVSIRDAATLTELNRFSTHGFSPHEIRLSPDNKYFVCGHYGSYLGGAPYKGKGIYLKGAQYQNRFPDIVYPASISLIDVQNGKLAGWLSDKRGGQEGHVLADVNNEIYLPNDPPLVISRTDLEKNIRFREGKNETPNKGEFPAMQTSLGICIEYDPIHKEVIVPNRETGTLYVTNVQSKQQRQIPLSSNDHPWIRARPEFVSGLEFHPDGKHYILSTFSGFIAMERGSHRLNPAMTFQLPLLAHSHMHIV
jgi:hypothetical protein